MDAIRATSIWNMMPNGSEEILELPRVLIGDRTLDSPLILLQEPGMGATQTAEVELRALTSCRASIRPTPSSPKRSDSYVEASEVTGRIDISDHTGTKPGAWRDGYRDRG